MQVYRQHGRYIFWKFYKKELYDATALVGNNSANILEFDNTANDITTQSVSMLLHVDSKLNYLMWIIFLTQYWVQVVIPLQ